MTSPPLRAILFLSGIHLLFITSFAAVDFLHCLGPIDLGGRDKFGFYRTACIHNHHFKNRTHAWNFERSIIKYTTFTSCGFENTGRRVLNLERSNWRNVTFKNCHFGAIAGGKSKSLIKFQKAVLQDVVFDGCTFHETADVIFSSFGFDSVIFKNCNFLSKVVLEKGSINRLSVTRSTFAPYTKRSGRAGHSTFTFSSITMKRISIFHPIGGIFRIEAASVSDLEMQGGTPESLICHEKVATGNPIVRASTLNGTFFRNVSFIDGIHCSHGVINGMELHDIKVGSRLDLSNSKIERLALLNVTSAATRKVGLVTLANSYIDGDRIKGLKDIHATFKGAVFQRGIFLEGINISTSFIDLTDTIFRQERITRECCTVACLKKKCKCDVSLEPVTGCPRGNSSVNINVRDSCFPASSTVSLVSSGNPQNIPVAELQYGHVIETVIDTEASEVFFFGHRTSSQSALFTVLNGHVIGDGQDLNTFTLPISPGHILPVAGIGEIAARNVRIGDVLFTSRGERAKVTEIRSRVEKGVYAPTTLSGKLSVNGIQVSCYTETVPPRIAHVSLAPLRALYRSGKYGREMLEKMNVLDEWSGGWIAASMQRLTEKWFQ